MTAQSPHSESVRPPAEKKQVSARSIVILLCVIALTVFAVMNRHAVPVWLIKSTNLPLFLVIFLSFFLGAVIGWMGKGIQTTRFLRSLRND
jgi:uncharacterized integral membrane protein